MRIHPHPAPLRYAGRAGLTLLELVVALGIAGVAVSAGYSALAGLVDQREALQRSSAEVLQAAGARQDIIDWLDASRLDPLRIGSSFRGLNGMHDGSADDQLTFLTGASTPLDVSRTLVTLRIARDSGGRSLGLVAELRDWDGTAGRTVVLSPEAAGLDVRFRSTRLTAGSWSASWLTGTVLPMGVEIRLEPSVGEELPPLLGLPILVALEGGN